MYSTKSHSLIDVLALFLASQGLPGLKIERSLINQRYYIRVVGPNTSKDD